MGTTDVLMRGRVSRNMPQPDLDGARDGEPVRQGAYGDLYVQPLTSKQHALADEGSYFTAMSPTPGTGLATIAALTTLVDTSPFILIQNPYPAGSGKPGIRVYLDYIKLIVTAAGTGGTAIRYAVKTDAASSARYTSGGTVLATNSPNQDTENTSLAKIYAGALVAAAAPQSRLLCAGLIRPVIPVVGDTYMFNFGDRECPANALVPSGVAISDRNFKLPAVIFGPQQWAAFHLFLTAQSAASSYEVEIGYWER